MMPLDADRRRAGVDYSGSETGVEGPFFNTLLTFVGMVIIACRTRASKTAEKFSTWRAGVCLPTVENILEGRRKYGGGCIQVFGPEHLNT